MSAVSDFGQTPRSALWSGVANSPLMLAGLGAAALTAGLAVSVRDVAPALSNVLMMAGPLGILTGAGGLWLGRRGTRGGPDGAPPGTKGEAPPASLTLTTVNNGAKDVAAVILDPVTVTKDNVKSTVIADGFWTAADISTNASYAAACKAAGIE